MISVGDIFKINPNTVNDYFDGVIVVVVEVYSNDIRLRYYEPGNCGDHEFWRIGKDRISYYLKEVVYDNTR